MTSPGVREFLLAFADDEHLMGQQHTEWIGVAPFLEEDLAFSSIGQDELGHAALIYELVLELDGAEPSDAAVDALAYRRSADDYRSSTLVEYFTTDWAHALVRHWIYDAVEELRWALVADSSLPRLVEIAGSAGREEAFHRRHGDALLDVLLVSDDARTRLLEALDTMMTMVPSLLEPVEGEQDAIAAGVASASIASLHPELLDRIKTRFGTDAHANTPAPGSLGRSVRSADFAPLMARMCEVFDLDPSAAW